MNESEDRIAQLRALGQNGNLQRVGAIDPDEHAKAMRVAAQRGLSTSAAAAVLRGATAGQLRQIDGEDFGPERPLSSRSPSLQAWLAKPDNKAIAQGDADAMSRIDDALQKLRPERGLVGDFEAALGEGFSGLEGSYYHLAAATGRLSPEEAAAGAAAAKRSIRASQAGASRTVQQYRQRLEESKGFGVIPAALSSPTGLAGMVLESLAFSAPPLALGGVGAVAGSAAGPIGTGVGLVAGSFIGGVATETGAWIDQQLEAAGVDTADEVALARAYRTPDLMSRIQAEAIRKGIGTAGIDALSTLIGMRGVSAAARAGGNLAKVGRLAGEVAVQSGLESAGEAVGQLAAVGTVDPKEVALEGVASLGQTGGEMVLGRGARFLAGRTVAGARSVSDTEAVREAAAAWPESKLVKRLPAKAREFVAAQLVGQDQELTAARFDREAWDAHWQAAGKDPAAELVRVLPATGRAAYLESEQTGTVTLPLGNFLDAYSSSTDLDELTELARWRPDGPTLREQSVAGQENLSDLEAEVSRTTTLYQREADIASQIARIDEQLKTLPVEGLPGEATPVVVSDGQPDAEAARKEAIEVERSALKEMLTVLSGKDIDPETRKIAEQEVAERKARLAELAMPAAKGAGEAKPAKATGRPALTAERVALKAELDGLVAIRQAEEGGEAIRQKVQEQLVAAGRPEAEAAHGATVYAAGIAAFASRNGMSVEQVSEMFPFTVGTGDVQAGGSRLAQTAFHGSPHEFTEFSLHKIGTGEGAQAFGWGLYFAGAKDVASFYRESLTRSPPVTFKGRELSPGFAEYRILLQVAREGKEAAIADLEKSVRFNKTYAPDVAAHDADWIERVRDIDPADVKVREGKLYTVDLAPAETDYLLWDKPLSEQSEKVKAALRKASDELSTGDSFWARDLQALDALGGSNKKPMTGADVYGDIIEALGTKDSKDASQLLARLGIPGIKYLDQQSRGKGEGSYNYVLFDDKLVKITRVEQKERGATNFGDPDEHGRRAFNVSFYAQADASTFIHELGHVFMLMLGDAAVRDGAPQQVRDDWSAIREFVGAAGDAPLTEDQHEQWARSWEAFIRDGKAPSAKLRAAFAAFRTFLVHIYRSLLDLERQAPGAIKLSDDIRAVMGRMLATDEEIAEAGYELGGESLPAEALSKMTDAEREDYLRAARVAKDEATAQADRSASETAAEQKKALRGAEMDVLRVEAALAVDASPAGQAYSRLREKGRPKLDRASVEALYGKAGETQRLDDMGLIQDRGGVAIDEAASSFGFNSGDALGKALLAMENREGMIERVARARLAAEHPELRGREAGRAAAKRSVANEERVALLEREQRILQRLAATATLGEKAEKAARGVETGIRRQAMASVPTVKAVRATAERMLAAMPLRAIRPNEYLSAARRESTASADRVRVGAFQKAAEAKGRERLNHELYRQALKIQKTADKDRKRAMFIAGDGAQKTLTKAGESYVDQANGILDRFEFRRISAPEAERRSTLTEWAAERETEGRSMEVPKWVLNEARRLDHQSLTPSQLHDVREVLDGIYHLARTKGELLTGKRQRDRAVESATIAEQVRSTRPPRKIITDAENAMERAGELGESFLAAGTKASTWTRMMDGNEDGGPATVGFVRRINDATDNKAIVQREAMEAYGGLYETNFDKATLRALNQRRDYAGVGLSHEARLSILSLMGAPEGRQRLKNILTADQLQAVLESFTEADTEFVKGRWALFDKYFRLAVVQQQKIAGQTPVSVEHVPFTITTADGKVVQMEGGYHPLQYKDKRLFSKQGKEWAQDAMAGRAPAAMFEVGFLKSRVEEFTGRLRLDRGVSVGHLLDITHALTMREAVIDVQALLSSSNVHDAIQETYGKAALHGLRDWLVQVAADSGSPRGGLEKVLGYLRHGAVSATLGMRVTSAFKQLYGIKSAIVRMGPGGARWMTLAAGRMMGNPATAFAAETWIDAKSKFMAERPRGTYQRELNEKLQSVTGKARSTLTYLNFYMLSRGQRVADRISFIAQYEKTMSEKPPAASMEAWDKEAVARAEQFVKDSQSGGQLVDLSEWESGNAITRLLTTYATEMSLKFNLTRLSLNRTRWKEAGSFARFLGDMTLLYFTEAAIAGLAIAAFGDDDDDEALEKAGRKALGAMADTMPILRELSGPLQGFRYQGSAGLMQVPALVAAAEQLMQGEMDAAMWKSLNTVGGSLFAYPAKAINDFGDAIDQVMEGDLPTALVGIRPER